MLIPPVDKQYLSKDLINCTDQDRFCLHAKCKRECVDGKICLFDSDNNQYGRLKTKTAFNEWLKNDLLNWISK